MHIFGIGSWKFRKFDRESESANGSLSRHFSAQVIRRASLPAMYVKLFLIHTFPRKPSLMHRRLPTPHLWRHDLIPHDTICDGPGERCDWAVIDRKSMPGCYHRAAETRHDVIDRDNSLIYCKIWLIDWMLWGLMGDKMKYTIFFFISEHMTYIQGHIDMS